MCTQFDIQKGKVFKEYFVNLWHNKETHKYDVFQNKLFEEKKTINHDVLLPSMVIKILMQNLCTDEWFYRFKSTEPSIGQYNIGQLSFFRNCKM